MSEWIKVEDKLPEKQTEVVFYAKPFEWWAGLYTPGEGFAYHQHWGDDIYHTVEDVTHWMPLPEPPSGN